MAQPSAAGLDAVGLLAGRRILVTGVLTQESIAYQVAQLAQRQGAQVVLTSFGRGRRLTERVAQRLPAPPPVLQLDVTSTDDLTTLAARVSEHLDGIDGILHCVAYAPPSALGDGFLTAPWADAATAIHVSAYSLQALTVACLPLMNGGSVVGLDFDASVAWPNYAWMGVAKAALESVARYLARELGPAGIRVNLVSAGPVRTMAAKAVADFGDFAPVWKERAPLGWDPSDAEPVARACVALLSDLFPATTGEIVHVDGGFHAVGQ